MITEQKLEKLIDEVQKDFLTSNNIINRTECPYYYHHPSVPKSLIIFKKRLGTYRQQNELLVAKHPDLPLPNTPFEWRNFSIGTFAHKFSLNLATALCGIGDCGECSAKLMLALIQGNYGNAAYVEIKFLEAKEGMEQCHSFIATNLPTPLSFSSNNTASFSVYDFLKELPPQTIIGDAFLGLTFSPDKIPDTFIRYINTYGGKTELTAFQHFYNYFSKSITFSGYLAVAEKVAKELKLKQPLFEEDSYTLEEKIKIEDTTLITLLKTKSKLSFFGVRDNQYKVDTIVELNTMKDRSVVVKLQRSLKGHGRLFGIQNKKEIFVLEGINLSDENPKLIQNIRNLSNKMH